jgi:hypothetical protein
MKYIGGAFGGSGGGAAGRAAAAVTPQHRLYFLPLPHGHGSFRPIFATKFIIVAKRRDVLRMSLAQLRAQWKAQLADRPSCVHCGSARVWHSGTRTRKASLLAQGFISDIPARRLKCRDCRVGRVHPPEGIPSRAHYQPCVVSRALERMAAEPDTTAAEIAAGVGCHRRTLGRWVDRVAAVAEPAQLAAAIVAEADAPVLPAVPTEVQRPGGRHVHKLLLRALAVLALLEALASLRGLEPPALAHAATLTAVRAVPADAPGARSRGDPRSRR